MDGSRGRQRVNGVAREPAGCGDRGGRFLGGTAGEECLHTFKEIDVARVGEL